MNVGVQDVLFDVLQQRATHAVNHTLGQARGAAGIDDDERVVEGKTGEGNFTDGVRDELRPQNFCCGSGATATARRDCGHESRWHRAYR